MHAPIRKAVFPVAGLGTRFLPATKTMPKEMLTVVDRPVIQHVVDEARAAGCTHFIFITGRNKQVIKDHFDKQLDLESTLRARGEIELLELLEADFPDPGQISFTQQQEPLGLGHAVWCARKLVGTEPFALLLPDMLAQGDPGCLSQMMDVYNRTGGNVIGVEEVSEEEVSNYGIVSVGAEQEETFSIDAMIEKPKRDEAPSNLMIMGRYILQPQIFDVLGEHERGANGEIQITDAMIKLMESQDFRGVRFAGKTYDCGSKRGFLNANVAFALRHPNFGSEFRSDLKRLLDDS
jgi:UTP--glucose-1-phosphate uridylyltransferase